MLQMYSIDKQMLSPKGVQLIWMEKQSTQLITKLTKQSSLCCREKGGRLWIEKCNGEHQWLSAIHREGFAPHPSVYRLQFAEGPHHLLFTSNITMSPSSEFPLISTLLEKLHWLLSVSLSILLLALEYGEMGWEQSGVELVAKVGDTSWCCDDGWGLSISKWQQLVCASLLLSPIFYVAALSDFLFSTVQGNRGARSSCFHPTPLLCFTS